MRDKIKKLMPKKVLFLLKQVRYVWITFLFHIFRIVPLKKDLIVLCNVWGIGDNAKYVMKELVRRKVKDKENYKIVFITNHPKRYGKVPNVIVCKTNSIKAIYYLAVGKVWVDNNRKENYIRKRKEQYYIQTWHGGIALKKIEKDYQDNLGDKYVKSAKKDSKMADLYISNSNFCTNMYRNSFWYQGEILECGSPRNDIIINQNSNLGKHVRSKLGISDKVKLAIYAPTYRESNDLTPYQLNYENILVALEKKFGGKFVLAVRLHPLVAEQSNHLNYNESIINATPYPDLYELMTIGDVLITDYSNIMFEFSFMKKPVFLYAKDRYDYEKERGFYFDYGSLPYDIATKEEELIGYILDYKEESYLERVSEFFQHIDLYESGNASGAVVDRILLEISK
jgi:CDP-glycerol glycerophosphotransferase